jgi:hypothetical protein
MPGISSILRESLEPREGSCMEDMALEVGIWLTHGYLEGRKIWEKLL